MDPYQKQKDKLTFLS